MAESKGLAKASEIYKNRPQRAKELKAEGKKAIGYLCIYPVLELMTALDLVPYRLFGEMREPITKADSCLPTVVCPFLRSMLDVGLKGKYDFLDGVVMAHVCEVGEKVAHIWDTYLTPKYSHFIDTPHTTSPAAQRQEQDQLVQYQKSLEKFTGKKITVEKLNGAIKLHNEQRALVRELYDLRKPDPPLISGPETLRVMVALMSTPVVEGNTLLRQVITEVKSRKNGPVKKSARLLVWGSIIDDVAIVQMMEDAGSNVVMDDTCVGTRAFFPTVKLTEDPLEGLAYRYLVDLKCPRTIRVADLGETKKEHLPDLERRFGYIRDYARDWKTNGVVLQSVRFCDIHGYDVPGLRDYLDSVGLPNIYIEHDYSEAALAPLRTRIQAFIELLG